MKRRKRKEAGDRFELKNYAEWIFCYYYKY